MTFNPQIFNPQNINYKNQSIQFLEYLRSPIILLKYLNPLIHSF